MVWRRPNFAGISKSRTVAACMPTWIVLITKSAPSSAARRSRLAVITGVGAELLGGAPGDRLGGLQALRRRCRAGRASTSRSSSNDEDVGEQLAGEHDAAGAEERDHGHGRIVGAARAPNAQAILVYRLETNYSDCAFDQSVGMQEPCRRVRCAGPTGCRRSSSGWPATARSTPVTWPTSSGSRPRPSAATCRCWRTRGCCPARTAARSRSTWRTSCRCATGSASTARRRRWSRGRSPTLLPKGPLTLGLTGGTTTHLLARLLAERVDLTVVTNALNIAAELALPPAAQADHDRRGVPHPVVRAGRPDRGSGAGRPQHGGRGGRRGRHQRPRRPHHARRDRGEHQRDDDPARGPGRTWWRTAPRWAGSAWPASAR